jgi:peptidoglycan/xylan/chitin deacetylase (PgdA/CDA1 family)
VRARSLFRSLVARPGAVNVLGHLAVERSVARLTGNRLRIVAYHDVRDADAFRRQIELLVERYRPVDEAAVVRALATGRRLDPRSVWVTFDDGHPGVVERAQPVLDDLGVRATVYVCPGLVDTDQPMWWEVVEEAQRRGLGPASELVEVKRLPDEQRRIVVARSAEALEGLGPPPRRPQLTTGALRAWLASGHSVGNHSWDHPCLDTCPAAEQDRQLRLTHDWLVETLGVRQPTFAYPNGNRSEASERTLRRLGYPLALLFDHRLADTTGDPMRLSRLRLSADTTIERARAIVSGAHPILFGAAQRLRGAG